MARPGADENGKAMRVRIPPISPTFLPQHKGAEVSNIGPNQDNQWHFPHPEELAAHLEIALIRDTVDFGLTPCIPGGTYVQLGHGRKFIENWIHIDYPYWNAEKDPYIPMPDNSVDGIATYNMLDHISNPREVIADCQRIMKDGAWLVAIVPHYLGALAHSCLDHKSQFAIDTWPDIVNGYARYDPIQDGNGLDELEIDFNAIFGLKEANIFLVTKFTRKPR